MRAWRACVRVHPHCSRAGSGVVLQLLIRQRFGHPRLLCTLENVECCFQPGPDFWNSSGTCVLGSSSRGRPAPFVHRRRCVLACWFCTCSVQGHSMCIGAAAAMATPGGHRALVPAALAAFSMPFGTHHAFGHWLRDSFEFFFGWVLLLDRLHKARLTPAFSEASMMSLQVAERVAFVAAFLAVLLVVCPHRLQPITRSTAPCDSSV